MYFRWKNRRIVAKIAVWGAREGAASQFLYTLADAVGERVAAGELEGARDPGAVGIPRNDDPLEVDEQDRRFTMYLCHPSSNSCGEFADHPVDYKLLAPSAPVRANRAFRTALEGASAVLFLAADSPDPDETALRALRNRLSEIDHRGPHDNPHLRVLLPIRGADSPEPATFRRHHDFADHATITPARPWNADDAWRQFLALADSLRPAFAHALEVGRIPPARK